MDTRVLQTDPHPDYPPLAEVLQEFRSTNQAVTMEQDLPTCTVELDASSYNALLQYGGTLSSHATFAVGPGGSAAGYGTSSFKRMRYVRVDPALTQSCTGERLKAFVKRCCHKDADWAYLYTPADWEKRKEFDQKWGELHEDTWWKWPLLFTKILLFVAGLSLTVLGATFTHYCDPESYFSDTEMCSTAVSLLIAGVILSVALITVQTIQWCTHRAQRKHLWDNVCPTTYLIDRNYVVLAGA
uniref:Uncharacterized protein n=1 Tax=Chromera velia CCMP2878 TaxID=1169474 RepID=A0A0G4FCD1_9ALVE|eukprot:Cvel_16314.t1-p1 / transcript=Cvel_16314.t1 / gene=Cvel_16314 / organism=Chromera_velia_CCMP2878 / gene_product=hypothetical protein / transcript_product=hypothetical protein / location=Cvel_scaffold1252:4074-4796(+) / protein_length=241 / sequence_SO=supercontig / SO=protein_coding / is_pseudo=false